MRQGKHALAVMTVVFSAVGPSAFGSSSILFVDGLAPAGGDGSSWATAINDFADALDVAQPGFEIWLREGVYRPDRGTKLRHLSFELRSGVTILGGFSGTEASASDRDPDKFVTILSGDLDGDDSQGGVDDNSYHVVRAEFFADTTTLDGVTITGGRAAGEAFHARGAGVALLFADLNLVDCRLTLNKANDAGGAISLLGGRLVATRCTFMSNNAALGGALEATGSEILVVDSDWISNGVSLGGAQFGGAAYVVESVFTMLQGQVKGNKAVARAGGVYAIGGVVTLNGVEFTENVATFSAGRGGSVSTASDAPLALDVTNCVFRSCFATQYGGAIYAASPGPMAIRQCLFLENEAEVGGAVMIAVESDDPILIQGSVFSLNAASARGGALRYSNTEGQFAVQNCAFSSNVADESGGAVWVFGEAEFDDCQFEANESDDAALSVVTSDTSCWIRECVFRSNAGSGLKSLAGSTLVEGCLFEANPVAADLVSTQGHVFNSTFVGNSPVGLRLSSSECLVEGCTFTANEGLSMQITDSDTLVSECDFVENSVSVSNVSAVLVSGGETQVISCRFVGNDGTPVGHGLRSALAVEQGATVQVANTLFTGNQTGGALASGTGTALSVVFSTFVSNTASGGGDGVLALGGAAIDLGSSIFWNNGNGGENEQIRSVGESQMIVDASTVEGWSGSFGGVDSDGLDPLLISLTGRDGVTGTIDDDLRLSQGSPAIDAGDSLALPSDVADLDGDGDSSEEIPVDLDGVQRVSGDAPDRGCYESSVSPLPLMWRRGPISWTVRSLGLGRR